MTIADDARDRDLLAHYLRRAATYHELQRTKVLLADTTMQRIHALCGLPKLTHLAVAYSLTPEEARDYAAILGEGAPKAV